MSEAMDLPPNLGIKEKIRIRPMADGDFNYVIKSWQLNFKNTGPMVIPMQDDLFFSTYNPIVQDLIKRSDVYIASLREDQDVIVGYLAIERTKEFDIIHYCSVKELWREMGIANYLLEAAEPRELTYFTHWTKMVPSLIRKLPYQYNPFLIAKECLNGIRDKERSR